METGYQHEVVVPDKGLPFKLFLFEGSNGKYIRETIPAIDFIKKLTPFNRNLRSESWQSAFFYE